MNRKVIDLKAALQWLAKTPVLACLVTGLLITNGCSNNGGRPPVEIHGVVTFDGQPLEEASILFVSPKTGESASSNLGPGGTYKVTFGEADIGESYQVAINPLIVDLTGIPASEVKPPPPLNPKLPKKYRSRTTSNLTALVKAPGKNEFNFDLSAK